MLQFDENRIRHIVQNCLELDTYNRYDLAEQSGLVDHFDASTKWFDMLDDYLRYSGQVMGVFAEPGLVIFICDGTDIVLYDRKVYYDLLKHPNKVKLPISGQKMSINDLVAGLQLTLIQIFDINNCDPKEVQLGVNRDNKIREWIMDEVDYPGYLVMVYCEKMMNNDD